MVQKNQISEATGHLNLLETSIGKVWLAGQCGETLKLFETEMADGNDVNEMSVSCVGYKSYSKNTRFSFAKIYASHKNDYQYRLPAHNVSVKYKISTNHIPLRSPSELIDSYHRFSLLLNLFPHFP